MKRKESSKKCMTHSASAYSNTTKKFLYWFYQLSIINNMNGLLKNKGYRSFIIKRDAFSVFGNDKWCFFSWSSSLGLFLLFFFELWWASPSSFWNIEAANVFLLLEWFIIDNCWVIPIFKKKDFFYLLICLSFFDDFHQNRVDFHFKWHRLAQRTSPPWILRLRY